MVNCSNSILINSRTFNGGFPRGVNFFPDEYKIDTPLPFSLGGVKNATDRTPFSGQTFLYERALGCKLVSTRATSTSLHVQWSASRVTSGREFETSFSDSNRVESELLKLSYQSLMLPNLWNGSKLSFFLHPSPLSPFHQLIILFYLLSFISYLFLFNNFNYFDLLYHFFIFFITLYQKKPNRNFLWLRLGNNWYNNWDATIITIMCVKSFLCCKNFWLSCHFFCTKSLVRKRFSLCSLRHENISFVLKFSLSRDELCWFSKQRRNEFRSSIHQKRIMRRRIFWKDVRMNGDSTFPFGVCTNEDFACRFPSQSHFWTAAAVLYLNNSRLDPIKNHSAAWNRGWLG